MASRDHTEVALRELRAEITVTPHRIAIEGRPKLAALDLEDVPSRPSSWRRCWCRTAAGRPRGVGVDPTRAALDFLRGMGARLHPDLESRHGD